MVTTLLFVATLLTIPPRTAHQAAWYDYYEQGIHLIEQGQPADAAAALRHALALRSEEGLDLPGRPLEYVDYLPHLYLAIAAQMTGDLGTARAELAKAERSGLAEKSEVGRPLLVAYELLLHGESEPSHSRPRYLVYTEKPSVLTDEEFATLERDVFARCGVSGATRLDDAPWYAFYELGLALDRKGDPQRALDLFIKAVERRPEPQRKARMYGMWLIDYYPYFQIARAHLELQNYECARDALEISKRLGEIRPAAQEYSEFIYMEWECDRALGTALLQR